VGSRAGLNTVMKERVHAPAGNLTPVVQPVAQSLLQNELAGFLSR